MDADSLSQLVPAVTSKWKKGSGGPSGDETQNLVAFRALPEWGNGSDLLIEEELTESPPLGTSRNERGLKVADEMAVRKLMPIECERLQAMPDNWTDPHGTAADTNRYAGIGDAVTVTVAEWIGRRIISYVPYR